MNLLLTRIKYGALLLLALTVSTISSVVYAQDLRATLFAEADALVKVTKEKKAFVLAPVSYGKGAKLYKQADANLKKGRNLASIQRDLNAAVKFLERSLEATKLAEVTFASVLKARNDARKAGGLKYAPERWREAEVTFTDSAAKLEGGNVKKAQKMGAQAEKLYRTAELAAIKGNYLNETKSILRKADQLKVYKFAPKTLEKAKVLLAKAERALTENRYDIDQPRDLARQAKYEANHAIYLAKRLSAVKDKHISMEDLLLEYEKPLVRISGAADIVAELDKGHEAPTREIVDYIETLQGKSQQLAQDLSDMEAQLGSLASVKESLKRLEAENKKAARIERMFSRDEAKVLRREGDFILRLIGLNFNVNKADINSRYFPLLSKVQNAIKIFPDSKLVIEGHTDSFGSDQANLALSQKRAESVRQYIMANMKINQNAVSAVGYGESRPAANNETPEGRSKNRRIDIVIRPRS